MGSAIRKVLAKAISTSCAQFIFYFASRRFGGGPACNRLYTCGICQNVQEMMDKRRNEELETFVELQKDFQNEKSSVPLYAISMSWFRKWEQFVKNRESPLPGPVDNLPITVLRNGNRILRPCKFYNVLHSTYLALDAFF